MNPYHMRSGLHRNLAVRQTLLVLALLGAIVVLAACDVAADSQVPAAIAPSPTSTPTSTPSATSTPQALAPDPRAPLFSTEIFALLRAIAASQPSSEPVVVTIVVTATPEPTATTTQTPIPQESSLAMNPPPVDTSKIAESTPTATPSPTPTVTAEPTLTPLVVVVSAEQPENNEPEASVTPLIVTEVQPVAVACDFADGDYPAIKGNIMSNGQRVYHTPESQYYKPTNIDEAKGEQWFCTEDEAVAAGWMSYDTYSKRPSLADRSSDSVVSGKPSFPGRTCEFSGSSEPMIKGNVASDKIYHTPESPYYSRTQIDPSAGDRWFCTVDDAVAAGFRAPK